jgi:uncharacterized membrane protein
MTFTSPQALILLLLIPLILYLGWPRQRYRRQRDIISSALRTIILLALILSLAGAQVVQAAEKLAVIFLVDASDSVGPVQVDLALEQIQQTISNMGTNDEAGIILFGEDARVERIVNSVREIGSIRSVPRTGNTNIADAIRLALALFPPDAARRIVIFSDGIPTLGDTEAAAELARASNVQISYVPISRVQNADARVAEFTAPSSVQAGQQFDLSFSIESDVAMPAEVVITAGGEEISRETIQLQQGDNNRTITLQADEVGFRDFEVVVETAGNDDFYQNNTLSTFSQIIGPSRILLVSDVPEEAQYILPALQEAGLIVDSVNSSQLPNGLTGLVGYDSVVLLNIPATAIPTSRMEILQAYTRDLGGGLVVVGGPESYGPGGYFQTPLEDVLPVEMQIKDQQRLPRLTIAYVIDRSGSMSATTPSGIPMIELAKEAINRSIDFLQPTDRAAIVTFDADAYWVAEFQDVLDRRNLQRLVGTLTPNGGTDILAGMRLVAEDIVNEPSELKHIILLTDGIASANGLVPLTQELLNNNNVTTSTIAIGEPSQLLESMAQAGGGNYHIARDISTIPTIFSQETVLATRSYIFEESFVPTLTARNPIMDGINALPELLGYVGTTSKAAAQVILRAPNEFNDPILAAWQYGLGRSVAFTSDATARWGQNWVSWEDFSRFWSQTVRWTITEGSNNNIEVRTVQEGEQTRVIVDARDDNGQFANGLTLEASVTDPTLQNQRIILIQVAPGRYEATFAPDQEGAYLMQIVGTGSSSEGTPIAVDQTNGWVLSYSAEYVQSSNTVSVLPQIAATTGGRSLEEDLQAAFARDLIPQTAMIPLAPLLLLFALVLLPFDVAVRRLVITRSDWQRLRTAMIARFSRPEVVQERSERVATLLDARDRARQRPDEGSTGESGAPASGISIQTSASLNSASQLLRNRRTNENTETERTPNPMRSPAPTQSTRREAPQESGVTDTPSPAPSPQPMTRPPSSSEGGNIGARLLRQRQRQEQDEDE